MTLSGRCRQTLSAFLGTDFSRKREKRGTGRGDQKEGRGLIKIEKREVCSLLSLFSLTSLSLLSLLSRIYRKMGENTNKKQDGILSFTHTISLLIVFGNFSKPPNMLSPPVDFFPLDDGILEGSMITCLMFARLHVYVTCTIPSLACIIAG